MLLCHFLSIAMPHWLLSSFGAKQLSFMKKQVLCFIPRAWSTHHWDFLIRIITITVFWLIWQCPLPYDTIRIWSAALVVSMCLFFIAHKISPNYLKTTSPSRAAISSSTYLTHTSLQCITPNRLRCGKCEGTSAEYPLPVICGRPLKISTRSHHWLWKVCVLRRVAVCLCRRFAQSRAKSP